MISNDKISAIIEDCKMSGFQVRVRDISFVILSKHYEDVSVAYKAIFGSDVSDSVIDEYVKSKEMVFLKSYLDSNILKGSKRRKGKLSEEDDITFDENKAEIINLIKETQKALEEGKIKSADALKIQADLRVKLNDKFNINDTSKDSLVCVAQKFDSLCPYCQHEVASRPMSKDEAMKMYNLKEK